MDDVIDEVQREWEAKLKESPDARAVHGKQGAQLMTGASIRGDARVILRDRRLRHRGQRPHGRVQPAASSPTLCIQRNDDLTGALVRVPN